MDRLLTSILVMFMAYWEVAVAITLVMNDLVISLAELAYEHNPKEFIADFIMKGKAIKASFQ